MFLCWAIMTLESNTLGCGELKITTIIKIIIIVVGAMHLRLL